MTKDSFSNMKRKFFIHNFLIVVLPLLGLITLIGFVSIFLFNTYVKDEIDRRNIENLSTSISTIDSMVGELERLNLTLVNNPSISLKLKAVLSKLSANKGIEAEDYELTNTIIDLISSSASINPLVASLYVYFNKTGGWFLSSTNRFSNFDFYYDTDWLNSFKKKIDSPDLFWFEFRTIHNYNFERGRDTEVLTIYHKIFSSGKTECDGVLVLNVLASQLARTLQSLTRNPAEYLFVLDANNEVLFQSSEDILPFDFNSNDSTQIVQGKKTKIYRKKSRQYGWQYVSTIPIDIVYSVPILSTKLIIMILLFSGVAGCIIAYALARDNYRQVVELLEIINQAKAGTIQERTKDFAHSDLYHYVVNNIVTSFLKIDYLKIQLENQEYKAKALELLALQSQLNPHFLFNTMQTILWRTIALTGGINPASMMMEQLSDILHYALDDYENLVPLCEEIRITNAYLEIQQQRYDHKFDVIWVLQDINPEDLIPKLLFQPLLENSLSHGISEKAGSSTLQIAIEKNNKVLKIRIIDNGIGIPKEKLKRIRKNKEISNKHIGLNNTRKRLKLFFPNSSTLQICSREGKGTIVTIRVSNSTEY